MGLEFGGDKELKGEGEEKERVHKGRGVRGDGERGQE